MENEKVGFLENIRLWWKFDGRYYHEAYFPKKDRRIILVVNI